MSELTLKDGRAIKVDVSTVLVKEFRAFSNPRGSVADENALVTKCTGLTDEEIGELTWVDLKQIVKAILVDAQNPLSDPN
jgi:hypothetical protein